MEWITHRNLILRRDGGPAATFSKILADAIDRWLVWNDSMNTFQIGFEQERTLSPAPTLDHEEKWANS